MAISSLAESKFPRGRKTAEHLCSVAVGTFFFVSGFGKLLNVNALIVGVQTYGVPYFLAPLTIFLPPLEIIIAVLLYFPSTRRPASIMVLLLLIVFSGVYVYGYFFRSIDKCGCMGEFALLDASPWEVIVRNAALFGMSLFVWRTSKVFTMSLSGWQRIVIFSLAVVAATASGASSIEPLYQGKHEWLGKNIHATPLSNLISTSSDVSYLLFFYSVNCPSCWDAIENAKAFQQQAVADSVIGFTFGRDSSLARFEKLIQPNFKTYLLHAKEVTTVTSLLPIAFYVRRDTILYIEKNHLMSPLSFKEKILLKRPILF